MQFHFLIIFTSFTGSCWGQCNGPPLILMPNNSTGNLAFPEANLDPTTGVWLNDHYYPSNANCTWILMAPPAHVINMRFITFHTEAKFDYVTIYSSEDRENGTGLFQFSGLFTEDWEEITPDNILILDFVSDEFTTHTGFQLAYRYMPKACVPGGVVLTESQLIALPPWNLQGALPGPHRPQFKPMALPKEFHFPGHNPTTMIPHWVHVSPYPPGMNCTWQLAVDIRDIIEIEFLEFETNPTDLLQIWKVEGKRIVPFIKFWEGQKPTTKFFSSSPLILNFLSDYGTENVASGFLLNITYVNRACSKSQQEIISPRGYISYPDINFKDKLWGTENIIHYGPDNCTWLINAPKGYVINITIVELDTRPNDQMKITDNNKQLAMYGGYMPIKRSLVSNTNEVMISFNSETESENSGFLLHYSWVLKNCEHKLPPGSGEIRSPYYPDSYGNQIHCKWTLDSTKKYNMVHFIILRLHIDDGDYLQMTDGKENLLVTSNSHQTSKIEFSSAGPIVIDFLSDAESNGGYFYLKYTVFKPGSCDFSLTTCGWKSLDLLHAWTLDEKSGIIFTEETDKKFLPRGYKSQLVSQILTPIGFDDNKPLMETVMCLEFDYLIKGPDAYQLNVAVESKNKGLEVWVEHSSRIYEINGPHGDKFLWAAINFTVAGYFRVIFTYERGYGPYYLAAIDSIQVKTGPCVGSKMDDLRAFSCMFIESFCGWKNTHSDNRNWQLGTEGIIAMENTTLNTFNKHQVAHKNYVDQFADLISPVVISANIFNLNESLIEFENSCLHFTYQIYSPLALLKVLIVPSKGNDGPDSEKLLWSGGKFASERILSAEVPLSRHSIPGYFRIIIRALSTTAPKFILNDNNGQQGAVLLKNITLKPGKCHRIEECTFSNGFCSWTTLSIGRTAWHIEEEENNSFAAATGSNGRSLLVSPQLAIEKPRSLYFRYKINSVENLCIQIAIKKGIISDVIDFNVSNSDVQLLWEQCKDKGNIWLDECIDLPIKNGFSQIVISVDFVEDSTSLTFVGLDDVVINSNNCHGSNEMSTWRCAPDQSLCGLTQSSAGFWKWVFVENEEKANHQESHFGFSCLNGDIITSSVVCNGYPDCKSAEDEMNCSYNEYAMPDAMVDHTPTRTTAVTCSDGRELSISWICDGIQDCEDGSDEFNCECKGMDCGTPAAAPIRRGSCGDDYFLCPSGSLCNAPNCIPELCIEKRYVCDGVYHCNSREDELDCPVHHPVSQGNDDRMECSGGLFIPKSFKCDGRKDCPLDGNDEVGCHHCGNSEYLCPTTGVCLPWSAVCDGTISIETCTDEDFCQICQMGYFACDILCLDSMQICDGVWDCLEGEDELRCLSTPLTSLPMSDDPFIRTQARDDRMHCNYDQLQCSSGRCIGLDALCDRIQDCEGGDDEISCPEDNFEKSRYISAKLETLDQKFDSSSSYLTTPILKVKNNWGILSFQYRLDSWIGPGNISLSIDMLKASGNESLLPSSLWRQSGNKGKLWIKEEIIVPNMESNFKLSFVMAGTGIQHHSEKIHIAELLFKPINLDDIRKLEEARLVCYFDDSWCGWNQAYVENGYTWVHTMSSPHSRRTGPLTGYSEGRTSGFLLADSLHGREGNVADLVSPALILPKDSHFLCLRLMVFLYGGNVVGISFYAQQKFSGHVFSKELQSISGSQGLNWISATIDIGREHLTDPSEPFFIVIRATRGPGIESDVAIDHVELSPGTCKNSSNNPIFLKSFPKHKDMYCLKTGIPSLSYVRKKGLVEDNTKNTLEEYCSSFQQCTSCVSSEVTKCSWCGEGHFCVFQSSHRERICSQDTLIAHKTALSPVAGPTFCARIVNDNNLQIYAPHDAIPILRFSIENIQKVHTPNWLCEYSISNRQSVVPKSHGFEDEMDFLSDLKAPDVDMEFWNMLKGFSVVEHKSHGGYGVTEVNGYFEPSSKTNNSYQSGALTCGNGLATVNLPEGKSTAVANIRIITPLGNELDNPDALYITIYNCESLAITCEACVSLNDSFDCGWCSLSNKCLLSTRCLHGSWNSHQAVSVCKIRSDLDILADLLGQDFENDSEELMMDAEDEEFYEVPSVKKKVSRHLRKSLQSRRERPSKAEQADKEGRKRRNKDGKGRLDRRRKSEENRKKERGKGKGRKKSFLKVPFDSSVYIARNMWRLHTGKQYYIPVKKKTMLNLGFVRQINYGDLQKEKSRTVLVDGKWKKAVGYFVDLFENAEDDPVTSIITTKEDVFNQLLSQL